MPTPCGDRTSSVKARYDAGTALNQFGVYATSYVPVNVPYSYIETIGIITGPWAKKNFHQYFVSFDSNA